MLIIEIILTVFVWKKGWRWMSLIPVGIAFLIGIMMGVSGTLVDTSSVGIVFIDVLAIIALILMLVYPPKTKPPTLPTPPTE